MSQQMPPPGMGPDDGPSEEEMRAYLSQMRSAPADQVLAEVLQGLLNAAQVKLGRNDARLLLDAGAAVADAVRSAADPQLVQQVDQAVSQLRMAQVEAEQEVAQAGQAEPNDLPSRPGGGGATGGAASEAPSEGADQPGQAPPRQSPPGQQPPDSPLNKLWIPGR